MAFAPNDKVQSISDPARVGIVERMGLFHAGQQFYDVFWGGAFGTRTVGEYDLRLFQNVERPSDSLRNGAFAGPEEFQRLITLQRLVRDQPLRNNIYAFNASRTQFYPYQFKPLLKFLDSQRHRLLICDEVGLGKTIEAGLILLELKARQTIRLVLVVCPANLRGKWRLELRDRFGEEFAILDAKGLTQFFDDYEDSPDRASINAIVSLETLRSARIANRLDELGIPFDLVIVDEAHHLRNFATAQREVGVTLGRTAQAMLMLTATPVHLGERNLFSLLNILDEEDFPDEESASNRFKDNEHIVNAQHLLASTTPNYARAVEELTAAASSRWSTRKELIGATTRRLRDLALNDTSGLNRPELIEIQRDLTEINLLGHLVTRTRKRDVHADVARRRAQAIELTLTDKEADFYNRVTAIVTDRIRASGGSAGEIAFRLTTPQRRMASSIHAMVEAYTATSSERSLSDTPDEDDTEIQRDPLESDPELHELISEWENEPDTKYSHLRDVLLGLSKSGRTPKAVVFATYKHTLRYLARKLAEDGITAVTISGDTPIDQRPSLIIQFKEDPNCIVLLSSRVGSEGLDFQFCSTVVNYDLPWNPMEVEQRIGRLDRIGQESPTIAIINFWTKGTVEEKILRRLYDRIGVFERSIGDLEPILGEISAYVQESMMRPALNDAEITESIDRLANIAISRRVEIDQLEGAAAKFVGVDTFFEQEVDAIRTRRRFVTPQQLLRFLREFIRTTTPRTRLTYDESSQEGSLTPDDAFKAFLRASPYAGDAVRILGAVGTPIPITFDAQKAFRRRDLEFISVLHPIATAVADAYVGRGPSCDAYQLSLRTERLPAGYYFFFVYNLRVKSARSYNTLECIVVSEELREACDRSDAEALLGEIVELAESPRDEADIPADLATMAAEIGERLLLQRLTRLKEEEDATNAAFLNQRAASLRAYYSKTLAKKTELLHRGTQERKQERYLRMLRGQVARLESELQSKEQTLESQKTVTAEYTELAAGILEIA